MMARIPPLANAEIVRHWKDQVHRQKSPRLLPIERPQSTRNLRGPLSVIDAYRSRHPPSILHPSASGGAAKGAVLDQRASVLFSSVV